MKYLRDQLITMGESHVLRLFSTTKEERDRINQRISEIKSENPGVSIEIQEEGSSGKAEVVVAVPSNENFEPDTEIWNRILEVRGVSLDSWKPANMETHSVK